MRILILFLLVAACSSPSIQYMGVEPSRQAVGGHVFDVYARADEVQVIRVNRKFRPDAAAVIVAGAQAAERATGCEAVIKRGDGDAAIMTFPIKCR